ncbi:MAG: AAA family ATPase [Patescibacteria group bacterium]
MNLAKNISREKLPSWFTNHILEPYEAGTSSVFILHGDINCLVLNPDDNQNNKFYIKFREFWRRILKDTKIVIFYNIASGITFLTSEMETKFKKAADIVKPNSPANDPVAAARADLSNRQPLPTELLVCLELMDKVLRKESEVAIILNSAHFIAPNSGGGVSLSPADRIATERLRNWSQSETIREKKSIVLLVTDQASKISNELRQSGNEIQTSLIVKPTEEERKNFIRTYTQGTGEQKNILARLRDWNIKLPKQKNDTNRRYVADQIDALRNKLANFSELYLLDETLDINTLTIATQGLGLNQIKELLIQTKKTSVPLNLKTVKEKKYQILSNEYSDVMEVVNADKGLEDIGGMEHLKKYFKLVIRAIKSGDIRRVPMGVTLMGPPGTGKTAFVEALAKEAGFHFIKIKNIRSMWVGESEARMEKLLSGLWSLVPVVIMNDEADLGEADRNSPKGDSGVSERLMRSWMTFLSDPKIRGKVIIINCTNRPDRMDAALMRSGRSDKRILLPMPSVEEIPAIFKVMFKRYAIKTSIIDFSKYAKLVDGRSGADIEAITLSSLNFASTDRQEENEIIIDGPALMKAIEDSIPSSSQTDIDYMTLVSLLASSSRELLPPNIVKLLIDIRKRNLIENIDTLFEQITERRIVDLSGYPQFKIK